MRPDGLPEPLSGLHRTVVMGVLNVTPDSFSDGGLYLDAESAVDHGIALHRRGADVVDVGGESTRPGAQRISAELECERVLPVVSGLTAAGVPVSIDTMRASTAEAAVRAGAIMVNDVSGGLADPDMYTAVAGLGVPYIAMHWRGHSDRMDELAQYDEVVTDVIRELRERADAAMAAGVPQRRIILDPGLGFAKDADHNWALLKGLPRLAAQGFPLLIGASRKRFLGALLADADDAPRPAPPSAAVSAIAAALGVWGVRVHEVGGTSDAVRVAEAWRRGQGHG
ncbi:MAG: dihydropteroate synthase [Ilumatobacteraceae bacterium]